MGSDITVIVRDYAMPLIVKTTGTAKMICGKVDATLDFASVNMCITKPTYNLVTDHLNLPQEDLSIFAQIFSVASKIPGMLILPLKMLNDKKFVVHMYESSTVFMSPNMTATNQDIVSTCSKVLIYIAHHKNKIVESLINQATKTIDLHGTDYDIPVNYWYTFNIDGTHQIFFFAHVSPMQKSVMIAVDKQIEADHSLLQKMKDNALNYFDQTAGRNGAQQSTNTQQANFI